MNGSRTSHWTKRGIAVDSVDLNFRMNATGNAVPELRKAQGAVQRLGNQIDKSNSRMRGFNNGITTMQANTRKFAMGGLQQAGYQLGDYAVQVANGTSKMQAFGQQAPQFLQIFGPFGAIIGAGVAIFSAFAVAMERSKKGMKETTSAADRLRSAFDTLEEIDDIAIAAKMSKPAEQALSKYSALFNMMQVVAKEKRDIAMSDLIGSMTASSGELQKLQGRFSTINKIVEDLSSRHKQDTDQYRQALELQQQIGTELRSELKTKEILSSIQGATRLQAADALATATVRLQREGLMTKEVRAQLDAFAQEQGLISAAANEANRLTEETAESADESERAAAAAAKLKSFMAQATAQAVAFSKAISAAPSGLQAMKDETATTLAQVAAIKSGYSEAAASAIAYRKQRELELGLADAGSAAEEAYLSALINKDVEAFEARANANAQLVEAMTKFDDLEKKGTSSVSKITKKIKTELSPEMKRLVQIGDLFGSSFENAAMSAVDGTSSVKDAFRSMASDIIKELYRIFVVKRITNFISNAAMMAFGPAVQGPTPSGAPLGRFDTLSFAGGGYTGNGARAGGLDGKGGRMAMIHPRETVVDHTKGQGMGGVTVIQNNTFGNGVNRAEINAMLPKIVEASKAAVLDAKRRGGSYGGAF